MVFGMWDLRRKNGIWDLGGNFVWDLWKIFRIWDLRLIH